jgi:hypothetical protein
VEAVLVPGLLEKAFEAGLRSLFVGFESVDAASLAEQRKRQNVGRDYAAVVRRIHDTGVMVNASFVFGMDSDGPDVFDRTVGWAVERGIETATFHIMTPYRGPDRPPRLGPVRHRHVVYQARGPWPTTAGTRSPDGGSGSYKAREPTAPARPQAHSSSVGARPWGTTPMAPLPERVHGGIPNDDQAHPRCGSGSSSPQRKPV